MVAAIVVLESGHFWLGRSTGTLTDQGGVSDVIYVGVTMAFSAVFAAVGWAIVSRQPRNTIGWLLLTVPLIAAIAFFVADYAMEALVLHPGSLPFGRLAAWVDRWILVAMLTSFIPIFLLFPDGRLPSHRWRPALWLTIAGTSIALVSFALTPGRLTGAFADLTTVRVINPLGIDQLRTFLALMTRVGGVLTAAGAVLAGIAIVARYRGATADVRQQIKWLRFVGLAFLVLLAANVIAGILPSVDDLVGDFLFLAMFITLAAGIPLACGVAILKFRLYDLDLVVRKTVVVGAMALFITLIYALIVGLGSQLFDSSVLSFVAAAVLALGFQPARERARKLADRLVYGERATPYEVLADFSGRMGETYAADDVLPRMAQVLADGTGAESATIWVLVGDELQPAVTFPRGAEPPGRVPDDAVDVLHQGQRLGALSVTMPVSEPMDPARHRLVEDLAAQAGLVLRNVGLIEELRASRQRLVAAQDEERRKLERNIHDGAQQQLVALSVQLKLARTTLERDPVKTGELLDGLQARAGDALEDLRDLARGSIPRSSPTRVWSRRSRRRPVGPRSHHRRGERYRPLCRGDGVVRLLLRARGAQQRRQVRRSVRRRDHPHAIERRSPIHGERRRTRVRPRDHRLRDGSARDGGPARRRRRHARGAQRPRRRHPDHRLATGATDGALTAPTTSPSLPMTQTPPGARLLSHSTGGGLRMPHADGRRSGRRRALVAIITTAMTITTVLAITAPARSAGRDAAAGRAHQTTPEGRSTFAEAP